MLLNKVDTQYEWLVQIGYDVKLMLYKLFVYSEAELVQASHWQRLVSPLIVSLVHCHWQAFSAYRVAAIV